MYHYVREIKNSKFSNIKGLEFNDFILQLDYFQKYYNIINLDDLISHYNDKDYFKLPPKALLLTFDDGYIDHYDYVYPELIKRKLTGSFYIPAKIVEANKVLDINKIHYILAKCEDEAALVKRIFSKIDQYRLNYNIEENDKLFTESIKSTPSYDTPEVKFIKQSLQKLLPKEIRSILINELLIEILGKSETELAKDLYMSKEQILELSRNKMFIGAHGYEHSWINSISYKDKELEISKSTLFLNNINIPKNTWTLSYPYGAYDQEAIEIIKMHGFKLGFTTEPRVCKTEKDSPFALSRIDTKDFPKNQYANPEKFYYDC